MSSWDLTQKEKKNSRKEPSRLLESKNKAYEGEHHYVLQKLREGNSE